MHTEYDAVVIGSGPNGLAAAIALVQSGRSVAVFEAHHEIGGGTRTADLNSDGVLNDVCSAAHPFGAGSPFFRSLPLADHGLEWCNPAIDYAHPLDRGRGAAFYRSIEETTRGLGVDGNHWLKLFDRPAKDFDAIAPVLLGPQPRVPKPSLALVRFGRIAAMTATRVANGFQTDEAKALFLGSAAHAINPLDRLGTAAVGGALIAAGHAFGWPVAKGGSHAITRALASYLKSLGGTVFTDHPINRYADLPPHQLAFFDTSPSALVRIAEERIPSKIASSLNKWRHGPGAFKLDLTINGDIPWDFEPARSAGVVHVIGSPQELQAAEADVAAGRMPKRPFILLGQQYLADPSRSNGTLNPIWMYAHVPNGYDGDATAAMLQQVERFAPGFRERIVSTHAMSCAAFEQYNANYVGGDIAAGATTMRQILFRPRPALNPYRVGPDIYMCSAASPPGAGVHGMCGFHAVRSAINPPRS